MQRNGGCPIAYARAMEPSPPDPPKQNLWTKQREVPRWLKWLEWEFIFFPFGPIGLIILGILMYSKCNR